MLALVIAPVKHHDQMRRKTTMGEIIEYDFGKARREVLRRFERTVADWLEKDELRRELASRDPFEFYRLFMQAHTELQSALRERHMTISRVRRIVDPAAYGVTHCSTTHRKKLARIHAVVFRIPNFNLREFDF